MSSKLRPIYIALFTLLFSALSTTQVQAAVMELVPTRDELIASCDYRLTIFVDASGQSSNSADVIINYDPDAVEIADADTSTEGIQISTGTAYQAYVANEVQDGMIRLAALSTGNYLDTKRAFGSIKFQAKPGVAFANFSFDFDGSGATTDSNVAESDTSVDLLTGVSNANLSFTTGECKPVDQIPVVHFDKPTAGQVNFPAGQDLEFHITDETEGIDIDTLQIFLNGVAYTDGSPQLTIGGDPSNYYFILNPDEDLPADAYNSLLITGRDFAGEVFVGQNIFNMPAQCTIAGHNLYELFTGTIFENTLVEQLWLALLNNGIALLLLPCCLPLVILLILFALFKLRRRKQSKKNLNVTHNTNGTQS